MEGRGQSTCRDPGFIWGRDVRCEKARAKDLKVSRRRAAGNFLGWPEK